MIPAQPDNLTLPNFSNTLALYRPLASRALLSHSLSTVIDFSLLLNYLCGYRDTGYVYESELLKLSSLNGQLQQILQLGYDMIEKTIPRQIRPEGVIQFWYYSLPTSSPNILDESNEPNTDNERFRSLHIYSESEDEEETIQHPNETITFLLVVHRDDTIYGGHTDKKLMNHGSYHIIQGNESYFFEPLSGEGCYEYIKVMYPCVLKLKDS